MSRWQRDQQGLCLPPWAPEAPSRGQATGTRDSGPAGLRCTGAQRRRHPACRTNTAELSGAGTHTTRLADCQDQEYLCVEAALLQRGWAPAGNTWRQGHPLWRHGRAESTRVSCEHGGPTQPVAQSPLPLLLSTLPVGLAAAPPSLLRATACVAEWTWHRRSAPWTAGSCAHRGHQNWLPSTAPGQRQALPPVERAQCPPSRTC